MREASDALSVEPEPYESAGPQWVVAKAEAELIARYGGLDDGELGLEAAMFEPPGGSFLLARVAGGQAVGAVGAVGAVEATVVGGVGLRSMAEGVGEVRRLWVDPSWRGRGVGRTLMARLEDRALELGLSDLVLGTGDRQPEAVHLYEVTGWERVHVDAVGMPLPDGYIRFVKAIG